MYHKLVQKSPAFISQPNKCFELILKVTIAIVIAIGQKIINKIRNKKPFNL